MSIESNFAIALVLYCYSLLLVKKNLAPLYQPITGLSASVVIGQSDLSVRVFPRLAPATCFALSFDWFIELSASVVIGQSDLSVRFSPRFAPAKYICFDF